MWQGGQQALLQWSVRRLKASGYSWLILELAQIDPSYCRYSLLLFFRGFKSQKDDLRLGADAHRHTPRPYAAAGEHLQLP